MADASEVRYAETRYRSVQPREIFAQLYPRRQKGVWSKLLSLEGKRQGPVKKQDDRNEEDFV